MSSTQGGKPAADTITHSNVEDAYARWAPIYDRVFTAVMKPGDCLFESSDTEVCVHRVG